MFFSKTAELLFSPMFYQHVTGKPTCWRSGGPNLFLVIGVGNREAVGHWLPQFLKHRWVINKLIVTVNCAKSLQAFGLIDLLDTVDLCVQKTLLVFVRLHDVYL